MFRKILVSIHHPTSDRPVFEEALALAKQTKADLMLLHVLSPDEQPISVVPRGFVPYYYPIITDELVQQYRSLWEEAEREGLDMLRALSNEAIAEGVTVEFSQNVGSPSQIICSIAKGWGADLIMLGRRGLSGLNEMVLGSVSNYVLHHAPCSVCVVQGAAHPGATPEPAQQPAVTTS